MRRREFIAGLGGAVAWTAGARAQQDDRVRTLLLQILRLKAETTAEMIRQFFREIEGQIRWTTELPWSAGTLDQRKFNGLRLLRQVPAIIEFAQLDSTGKEQLRVSRLSMDVVAHQTDFSQDPKFTVAMAKGVYYGPVFFGQQSDPYMTLSLAGTRRDFGVSVAEVNLKAIWNAVLQMKVGDHGVAYIVDAGGRVILHPDASFQSDFSNLAQVQAARAAGSGAAPVDGARDIRGREVLSAYAAITPLGWFVLVEQPAEEVNAPAR
jgi:Cache domain